MATSPREVKHLRAENKRLRMLNKKMTDLLANGLPHPEVLDAYIAMVNAIVDTRKDPEKRQAEALELRSKFFYKLEAWLQMFVNKKPLPQEDTDACGASSSTAEDSSSDGELESPQTETGSTETSEKSTQDGEVTAEEPAST